MRWTPRIAGHAEQPAALSLYACKTAINVLLLGMGMGAQYNVKELKERLKQEGS